MDGLITTVRERYGRAFSYRGLITLAYREQASLQHMSYIKESWKRGFLSLLRPQLQGVSNSMHQEISKLMNQRDKLLIQTITRDMPKIIGKNTEQMRSDSLRLEKALTDRTARLEKRVDLLSAGVGDKLKAAERELARIRAAEKAKTREEARIVYEQSILERDAQSRKKRDSEREREELKREVEFELIRTERRIVQKLRDEEDYEKRRRG